MDTESLYKTAKLLMTLGKGILAADQSVNTMNKQLEAIGAAPEAETRRLYRQLLFTAPGIERYVTGIILYDATIRNQTDEGTAFVDHLIAKGIIPIIKVDKSTVPFEGFPGEVVTEGLDGLKERLEEYFKMGARAAKWRAVINVGDGLPTLDSIKFNCMLLARYARLCQEAGIVPIVEPEVIYEGTHDLARAEEVTTLTLRTLFTVLTQYRVDLKATILKTSMVLAGSKNEKPSTPEEVAEATLRTLDNAVPNSVAGIVFLSGGQTPEQVTANFNAIGKIEKESGGLPWALAFSFSRGIEQPVQEVWKGQKENVPAAQQKLIEVLERNCKADQGQL
jgi:fructose-bisphosphate aldolase class I